MEDRQEAHSPSPPAETTADAVWPRAVHKSGLTERITRLKEESIRVLRGAVQSNGAIIAADSRHARHPDTAVNYDYMWLRDAAEILEAMAAVNLPETGVVRIGVVRWVNDTMLRRTANPGGPKVSHKRHEVFTGEHDRTYYTRQSDPREWQPDNNARLVAALINTGPVDTNALTAIRSLCNGLVENWDDEHTAFRGYVENQWENHIVEGRNFTDTTLAAAYALTKASRLPLAQDATEADRQERVAWAKLGKSAYDLFEAERPHPHEGQNAPYLRLLRVPGIVDEFNPLDSGASLELPRHLRSDMPEHVRNRAAATLQAISGLTLDASAENSAMGRLRYHGDTYDGIYRPHGEEDRAGEWPLLLFGQVIALCELDETDQANDIFLGAIRSLDDIYKSGALPDNLLPEQVFPAGDDRQGKGVMPLAWTHAMFLRAAKTLGYI